MCYNVHFCWRTASSYTRSNKVVLTLSLFLFPFSFFFYFSLCRKHALNCHRMKPALFSVLCEIKEKTGKSFNPFNFTRAHRYSLLPSLFLFAFNSWRDVVHAEGDCAFCFSSRNSESSPRPGPDLVGAGLGSRSPPCSERGIMGKAWTWRAETGCPLTFWTRAVRNYSAVCQCWLGEVCLVVCAETSCGL